VARKLSARPGFPAFIAGVAGLVQLAAARALLQADEARVYLMGHALQLQCAFRAATGLPCPTCGISRGIVMSVHGELARAWKLAPAAPFAVCGLAALSFGLLALGVARWAGRKDIELFARRWFPTTAFVYASALTLVWIGGWVAGLRAALASA
jgi:hypothetical protein